MIRAILALTILATTAGCVCSSGHASPSSGPGPVSNGPPPPPPPPRFYKFMGAHPIPAGAGGGWDNVTGRHDHPYPPEPIHGYRQEGEYFVWKDAPTPGSHGNSTETSTSRSPTGSSGGSSGNPSSSAPPHGSSANSPGHGGTLPPGHGGTPPGQVKKEAKEEAKDAKKDAKDAKKDAKEEAKDAKKDAKDEKKDRLNRNEKDKEKGG